MALTNNGIITYQDLMDGIYDALKVYGKNIGTSYAADVPDQLKSSYTFSQSITVTSGNTPKVVWTNSNLLGLVAETTVKSQFDAFCSTWFLTNDANANTPISMDGLMRFISALVCFIDSKFAVVYSPLTAETKIFYFANNTIQTGNITDIDTLNDYIIDEDGKLLADENSYLATGSKIYVATNKTTNEYIQSFIDKITNSTLILTKSFCAVTSITTQPA